MQKYRGIEIESMTIQQKQSISKLVTNLIVISIVSIIIWLTGLAINKGDTAIAKANEIEKVQVAQSECNKYIVETMKEIKDDVKEIKREMKK